MPILFDVLLPPRAMHQQEQRFFEWKIAQAGVDQQQQVWERGSRCVGGAHLYPLELSLAEARAASLSMVAMSSSEKVHGEIKI